MDEKQALARFRALAESYLRHISEIVAVNDRGARLRDFLDPWWVYERQFWLGYNGAIRDRFVKIDKDGICRAHTFDAPCPVAHRRRLPQFDFVSPEAQKILDMGLIAKKHRALSRELKLVCDHVVPFEELSDGLFGLEECKAPDGLRKFLRYHFKRAIVTKAEHEGCLGGSLKNGMPEGWKFWDDPFARYKAASIL